MSEARLINKLLAYRDVTLGQSEVNWSTQDSTVSKSLERINQCTCIKQKVYLNVLSSMHIFNGM